MPDMIIKYQIYCSDKPSDTLAGTADWLIQKDTQDIATSRIEGM